MGMDLSGAITNCDCSRCLDRLEDEVKRLRAEIAEWKHRAIGGQCRILSEGDKCDCSLCVRDAELERLRELCGSAAHWLTLPPTTNSDRDIAINLSRKLKEAAEAGRR